MKVETYELSNGRDPVGEYVEAQDPKTQKKMLYQLERLESVDPPSLMRAGILTKITNSNPSIYELKISYNKKEHRIFGGFVDSCFWLVHAFLKKEQKTRESDIRLAEQRLKEVDKIIK
jgi:phage-related protein